MDDPDVDCMRRLREGEDLALNEIMSRWQQKLANYTMRFIGNEADAIDLTQETFVRVYQSRLRYEPRAAFSTWLFQIATNLCRSHARWRNRHPTFSIDADSGEHPGHEPADHAPDPSREVQASEQAAEVQNAVAKLPADLKTVILLYEFEDLSYAEISNILKCSVKAVETRLARARQILSRKLKSVSSPVLS